jgi:hypothetical protein
VLRSGSPANIDSPPGGSIDRRYLCTSWPSRQARGTYRDEEAGNRPCDANNRSNICAFMPSRASAIGRAASARGRPPRRDRAPPDRGTRGRPGARGTPVFSRS